MSNFLFVWKAWHIVTACSHLYFPPFHLRKDSGLRQYEPELFPGLIYRMVTPKIVLLIFVSGKIVLTGAKVREEIYRAFEVPQISNLDIILMK
jgi:hypothetical protein